MATLNVKAFPDELYEELRRRAQEEHRSISQQVVHLVASALKEAEPLSILELEGLGKDLWQGVDAARHVRKERDSWD